MDVILRAKTAQITLESFVRDFDSKLEQLIPEQKKWLVELLVDRVEVSWSVTQTVVNTVFRFDQSKVIGDGAVDEPKKGSPKPQSDDEEPHSEFNGATSRARTYDLSLRRAAL